MTEVVTELNAGLTNGNLEDSKDDDSFGIANGRIPDNAIYSSSALNAACGASQARLNKQPMREYYGAWSPMYNDKDQYLDIDFGDNVQVGAIATQGRPGFTEDGGWFVKTYSLASSTDGENFTNLREYGISKVFEGNTDPEAAVKNTLKLPLKCRYLRIKPVTWHNKIALRVEVYKFTGAGGSRKRSTPQRAAPKSSTDRGKSRQMQREKETIQLGGETMSGPQIRVKETPKIDMTSTRPDVRRNDGRTVEQGEKEESISKDTVRDDVNDIASSQNSFEVIDIANNNVETEMVNSRESTNSQADIETKQQKIASYTKKNTKSINEVEANENSQARKIDEDYTRRMKQASAVSTHNDGTKYIGKIKLIKREEPTHEDEDDQHEKEKKVIDCEIPHVVKQRLTDYDTTEIRRRDSKKLDDLSKRRSMVLEEDLNYVNQMEVSMHERLQMFKETEGKAMKNSELSKHEEEKRMSLKRDAEKRRSAALQKEQERLQALIQKQKEEEEEKRKQREKAEAEANEEFVEIDATDAPVPPAIVNERLRMFKDSEQHEREKQEVLRLEAEKRRSAKELAEQRRLQAEERERERLQELKIKLQNEEELRKQKQAELENENLSMQQNSETGVNVPAIVHDRLKLFKDGERAEQEKKEALKKEELRKQALKDEAEKRRAVLAKQGTADVIQSKNEPKTSNKGYNAEDEINNQEEEIIVVEDAGNVESEISFDFMENGVDAEENVTQPQDTSEQRNDQGKITEEELRMIREAKQRFVLFEKGKQEEKPAETRKVGKLKREELPAQSSPASNSTADQKIEEDEDSSRDLQERLEEIDTHHEGYDPDQERRMLEEAEAAFRNFAVHQKTDKKPKRSAKTANLIKSFSVAASPPPNQSEQKNSPGKLQTNHQRASRPPLESSQSLDVDLIVAETSTDVCSAPDNLQAEETDRMITANQDSDVIDAGIVKQRANIFTNATIPQTRITERSTNANVKKWLATNHQENSPRDNDTGNDKERVALLHEIQNIERRIEELNNQMEDLKAEDKEEEAFDVEEELNMKRLELTKLKRKLTKMQRDIKGSVTSSRKSSSGSESRSISDEASFDRASSTGSRTPRGGSGKTSKEQKAPVNKPQPHVDVNAYNDDGEVVPEGNVITQIQTYEHESAKQRKEMAEIRKSLRLSHSSIDSIENPPPTGYGGPQFAKDKMKLSRECKLPRGTPVPAVEYTAFNDDGDCVQEGNVLQQVKTFSKN